MLEWLFGFRGEALADLRAILREQPDNAVARQGVAYMTGGRGSVGA